jgi:hypothetical protein
MKTCPICGKPALSGFDTCGNSYCQEAKFYRSMAKKHSHIERRMCRSKGGLFDIQKQAMVPLEAYRAESKIEAPIPKGVIYSLSKLTLAHPSEPVFTTAPIYSLDTLFDCREPGCGMFLRCSAIQFIYSN